MSGKLLNISKMRIAAQQLNNTNLQTAEELVGCFGAVQGQEYAQTKWAVTSAISCCRSTTRRPEGWKGP